MREGEPGLGFRRCFAFFCMPERSRTDIREPPGSCVKLRHPELDVARRPARALQEHDDALNSVYVYLSSILCVGISLLCAGGLVNHHHPLRRALPQRVFLGLPP
jgi:hypothetical protein